MFAAIANFIFRHNPWALRKELVKILALAVLRKELIRLYEGY